MWRDTRILLGVHLRMRFSLSILKEQWKGGGKPRRKLIGMAALMLYAVIALVGMYGLMLWGLFTGAAYMGLSAVVMSGVALLTMLAILIFGTFSLLSLVMNARDAESYAAMPLRPGAVFAAKFGMVYLTELLFAIALLVPAAIVYAITSGGDIWLFVRLVPLVLLTPMIPLAASSLVALPLTRATALFRRREMFTLIFGLVAIFGSIFAQLAIQRGMVSSIEDPTALLSSMDGLLKMVTAAFPPAGWLANSLLMTGATPLLDAALYVLLSAALLCVAILLANRIYLRAVLASAETVKKAAPAGKVKAVSGSQFTTMMQREIRVLLRSPVYALNALVTPFIFPLMLLVLPLMQAGNDGMSIAFDALRSSGLQDRTMLLILTGIFGFMSFMNPAATTSISREGRAFDLLRSMPLSAELFTAPRLAVSLLIETISLAFCAVVVLVFNIAAPWIVVTAVLLALVFTTGATAVSMIPDIRNPKLDWTAEAEAMKQNMNSLWGMLLALLALLVFAVPAVLLWLLPLPALAYAFLLLVIFAAAGYGAYKLLLRQMEKKLASVGD